VPTKNIPLPVEQSDVEIAFPAHALDIMPAMRDMPVEFQDGTSPWCDLQQCWFALGMSDRFSFEPATINGETLDPVKVFRHLKAIQGSFAPKHEHKVAAVSYLASIWMKSVIYGPPGTPDDQLRVLGEASLEEWLAYFNSADTEEEEE